MYSGKKPPSWPRGEVRAWVSMAQAQQRLVCTELEVPCTLVSGNGASGGGPEKEGILANTVPR